MTVTCTDDGSILWHCFRAACGESGRSGAQGVGPRHRHQPRRERTRPYDGPLEALTDEQVAYLHDKVGWTEQHIAMARPRWAPEKGRYAFPILDPMGTRRGYVLRSYDPDIGDAPKALTRMDRPEPHLSWYRHFGDPATVLVVEDIPSAVRAGMYVHTVSLVGTGCGPDYINEIVAHSRNVVWALDADATALAVKWNRKYTLLFDSSRVLPLERDLKDMDEKSLRRLLEKEMQL